MVTGTLLMEAATPVRAAKKALSKERQTRHGAIYDHANRLGILDPVARGDVELDVGLALIKANMKYQKMTVSKDAWRRAVNERKAEINIKALHADWKMRPAHVEMLGLTDAQMYDLAHTDTERFEAEVDVMVKAFVTFRSEFMVTPRDTPYLTKKFHRRWIRAILVAIYRGERLMILANPRSGKTDLLIHFMTWRVIRNSNVQLLWVGASGPMAEKASDAVRNLLENHEELRAAFLPPDVSWRPMAGRAGGTKWSASEFTVSTRTIIGSKSPTVVAVGSRAAILSRDTSSIFLDDIEDSQSVETAGGREKTRAWFDITIESRKERETSIIVIGSRQHFDDLYRHLIERDTWTVIVESAHDHDCDLDPDVFSLHTDCMIFPERFTYAELMEKKQSMSLASFELQYLNVARASDDIIFDPEDVDACINSNRMFGLTPDLPDDLILLAGLDPSPGKTQAAVLWGVSPSTSTAYVIDMSYGGRAGVPGAQELMVEWFRKYGLTRWWVEKNSWQKHLYFSAEMKQWAIDRRLIVRGIQTTGHNKWDPILGVTALVPLFEQRRIDIPAKGEASKLARKMRRQFINFVDETVAKRKRANPADLVMAAWFPFPEMLKIFERDRRGPTRLVLANESSYPSYGEHTQAPWGYTPYPGQTQYPAG
jgi:hypothetical protein